MNIAAAPATMDNNPFIPPSFHVRESLRMQSPAKAITIIAGTAKEFLLRIKSFSTLIECNQVKIRCYFLALFNKILYMLK